MARRITMADVAKKAGVSTATVDRVINRRRPVKLATATAVESAAKELGFYASTLIKARAEALTPPLNLGFVLQKESKDFYRRLGASLDDATAALTEFRGVCRLLFVDELSPNAVVHAVRELSEQSDAIGVVALDHPHVIDEIRRLKTRGIPVWALLSGVTSQDIAGFVGVDNRKAGRTAAWGMERCARPDSAIGVMIGSYRYAGHEDREGGFRSYFREKSSGYELVQSTSYLDDDQGAYEGALDLFAKQPGIGGIYVIGGGAAGAVKAFREEGMGREAALICHEFNVDTRDALIEGVVDMVLDTPVDAVAKAAVARLANSASPDPQELGNAILPFDIYVSENI